MVLGLNFHNEELAEWTEGEGWLDELVELREELIQGDFRVLYLAWLKAAENALGLEGIDKDTMEPPVPPGLNQLSDALKTFVRFLVPLEKYFLLCLESSYWHGFDTHFNIVQLFELFRLVRVRKGSHVKMKHPDGRKIVFP